jgi:hypothetical protein
VRWSYMIYGSRGSDGDVDEPAGEWRERCKSARKVERAQRQEEAVQNKEIQRISLLPSLSDDISHSGRIDETHIPEKGETCPEDVPQ